MTPQAALYLDKARQLLNRSDTMLRVRLTEDAGRTAYLAGFHAAQALIFESRGKALKSHSGVQTEFLRLTKNDARLDPELRAFLGRAHNLKAIADYEIGPGAGISIERAAAAVETGKPLCGAGRWAPHRPGYCRLGSAASLLLISCRYDCRSKGAAPGGPQIGAQELRSRQYALNGSQPNG